MYWSAGAFFGLLAMHQFSPTWLANNSPDGVWPPGKSEADYVYSNAAPLAALDASDVSVPSLVLEARKRGAPL